MTASTRVLAAVVCAFVFFLASPAPARAQQPAPADSHAAGSMSAPDAAHAQADAQPPSGAHEPGAAQAPADAHGAADTAAGEHAPAQDAAHAPEGEHADAEHESPFAFPGRLFNFLVLLGGMIYFLKTPLTNYLTSRSEQIRSDLLHAAATREAATKELADIDARMRSLPAELEALKARGKEEIAAEQARIKAAAEAERRRLVEQAGLEIAQQTRAARRELQEFAATLAVDVARARLATEMTDADQSRLVERYAAQVKTVHD